MNQTSLELWKKRIQEQKESGLQVIEWCKQNNQTKSSYYDRTRKIRESDMPPEKTSATIFESIPIHYPKTQGILLIWKDIQIQVTRMADIPIATQLLYQLQKTC